MKRWADAVLPPDDPLRTPNSCNVCGLKMEQLPPALRFIDSDGEMLCTHHFGIPAKDVPDYLTHHPDGRPYE